MKKIILIIALAIIVLSIRAQENKLISLTVPSNLNIKDKIILVNKSSCTILRAVLVLADIKDKQVLGTCNIVVPEGHVTMAEYSRNGLRQLRGRKLGIKVKGYTKMLVDNSSTSIGGGGIGTGGIGVFGVGVSHSEVRAEDINNLSDENITYDFSASLSENNHDLYIYIFDNRGVEGVLDF